MLPELTVIVSLRPRHRLSAQDRDAYRNGAIAVTGLIGGFPLLAYWLLPVAVYTGTSPSSPSSPLSRSPQ